MERPPAADGTGVSLIVPVFNSQATLNRLFESIAEFRKSSGFEVEIVFVDDGSSDGSAVVLRNLQKQSIDVAIVELPLNRGQAKATLAGVLAARNEVIVTFDDDLQFLPEDIPRLLQSLMIAGPSTLVMGISDSMRRPLWRTVAGTCCNVISNLFLSKPLPLRLTTFCAFHRRLALSIDTGSARDVALFTELVQAADRTLAVPVQLGAPMQRGRYTFAALVRLFVSRARCYKPGRVLVWLAGGLTTTAASALAFATRGGADYALVFLASALVSSLLAVLAISVMRAKRADPSL